MHPPFAIESGYCSRYHSVGTTPAWLQIKYQHEKDHRCVCVCSLLLYPPMINLEITDLHPRFSRTEPHVFQVEISVVCGHHNVVCSKDKARNIYSWDFISLSWRVQNHQVNGSITIQPPSACEIHHTPGSHQMMISFLFFLGCDLLFFFFFCHTCFCKQPAVNNLKKLKCKRIQNASSG